MFKCEWGVIGATVSLPGFSLFNPVNISFGGVFKHFTLSSTFMARVMYMRGTRLAV